MNTTTDGHLSTVAEIIEERYFCPPVMMKWDKGGCVTYVPVQWEKDLVMYDLTLSQVTYPDGTKGDLRATIKIDSFKNVIKDRFEVMDL